MSFVLVSTEGGVQTLTLNRPEVLNAWHRPMRDLFTQSLLDAGADSAVRAVIVTGAGDRAFCAGQDLNEASNFHGADAKDWIGEWRRLYGAIRGLSKPLIMALNGVAAGSAFQAALLGDIRVGYPGTRMGQPEILSGLASITGPAIMREALGISRTVELALTGRMMDGTESHAIGLMQVLVPTREEVLPKARALAAELATRPRDAMRETKAWLRLMTEDNLNAALDRAESAHATTFDSDETHDKIRDFTEKS